jgi:Glycosyl Hydrolase Family 88
LVNSTLPQSAAMRTRLIGPAAALALALSALAPAASEATTLQAAISHDLEFAAAQLKRTLAETPTRAYPSETGDDGRWRADGPNAWISGFFPGSLWLMYEATGKPRWRSAARARQKGIEPQQHTTATHDLGFMVHDSFGQGYRLTGNDHFRRVAVTAARSLAKRYSKAVRAIRSLNEKSGLSGSDFRVIVDSMMNLELLFWASHHGGGAKLASKAHAHALRVAHQHLRPDGSTYQMVVFDSRNGRVKGKETRQGLNATSTWSRGQAWALYGFTMAHRKTHDGRMLIAARLAADYYVSHLPPDKVPYWDFEAAGSAPRDSSAAAIAASGLIELSQRDPDPARRERYLNTAEATLRSLSSKAYLAEGTKVRSILLHGTADKRGGRFDHGLIYGDYYFLEALLRYRALPDGR